MPVSTGCNQLDLMLGGGIPMERSVLVTGGPGVGKSTLAMQFLQEGLDNDEQCLYISTEQTTEELRSSFAPFSFDLDHENLALTSIHASPSNTIEESETGMALQTLSGDETIDGPFTYPFDGPYIIEYLEQYAPCDRVVLDSASGLAAISDDHNRFRRVILDLIRLFTDTFEATTLFTAEDSSSRSNGTSFDSTNLLQFTTNGVIRLWWDSIQGSRHRFLQIVKMRGVDHDTRNYEVRFTADGLDLTPQDRASGMGIDKEAIIPTRIEGLDEMCGGLVRGHSALLEYDGRALVDHIVAGLIHTAFVEDMAVWFFPSPIMSANRLQNLLPHEWDFDDLLSNGQFAVLDGFGAWTEYHDHPAVFYAPQGIIGSLFRRSSTISMRLMKRMAQEVNRMRGERYQFGVVYTEAFLRWLDPSQVKEVYYYAREMLAKEYDTGFFVHNPETMEVQLAEFFHSDAVQVFESVMDDNGIQYLNLNKSPVGQPGQSAVIDFSDDGVVVRSD